MQTFEKQVLIDVVDDTKGSKKANISKKSVLLDYPCDSPSSCTPYIVTLNVGRYQFECWGARGSGSGTPGLGAYTSGIIKISKLSTFFVNIGATAETSSYPSAIYNCVPFSSTTYCYGGGATDVRLYNSDSWMNTKSLISRIMVAAGGGGAEWPKSTGGNGGAPNGGDSYTALGGDMSYSVSPNPTFGATNEKGGYCTTTYRLDKDRSVFPGSFGIAGYSTTSDDMGGIGGGGHYGGGTPDYGGGGSGGSSFVSGHPLCNSVKNSTAISASGSSVHFSGLKFSNPKMIAGSSTMPLPTGGDGTWSASNGRFKLTIVEREICTLSLQRKIHLNVLFYICIAHK